MTTRIGIIGPGPAGLTTALALEQGPASADVELTLLDRNHNAVDYPGVEYGIQARACRALDRLGLKSAALTVGHPEDRIVLHVMRTDRDQLRIRVDPKKTYGVERPEFLENLSKLLRRTEILRDHNVSEIEALEHGRVRLRFHDGDASSAPREFDIVIACDGAHSLARKKYFPAAGPVDRGFSAIYLLVVGDPADPRVPEAFPNVANGSASEIVMGNIATNALFPQGENRLTIALGFDSPTRDRLWRERGLSAHAPWQPLAASTKEAIARALAQDTPVHDGLMERALELVEDWNDQRVYLWAMHDSDALRHPYAPDCNLVLVGDSCHAFLPTIGMGANLAIEDAQQLGCRLADYLGRPHETPIDHGILIAEVFEPWAAGRWRVWTDLMRRARAAAHNWVGQSDRRRFDIAPYVPTRIGCAVVGAAERLMGSVHRDR